MEGDVERSTSSYRDIQGLEVKTLHLTLLNVAAYSGRQEKRLGLVRRPKLAHCNKSRRFSSIPLSYLSAYLQ